MQTCDARIRVRVPPSPPQFIRPLEDRVTQEGGTITLETEISGFPRPKVSFMLQNKTVRIFKAIRAMLHIKSFNLTSYCNIQFQQYIFDIISHFQVLPYIKHL